jgi:hypothetical protein
MSDSLPVDEISEDQPTGNHNRRFIPEYYSVPGLLVFAHAAFGMLCSNSHQPIDNSSGYLMMLGFLFSQPILIATWVAFAPQRFYNRFLWGLLFFTLISFSVGFGKISSSSLDFAYLTILDLTIFIMGTLILLLVRRLLRWHIIHPRAGQAPSDYQENQFGIKHLIILTTIIALACGLFRTLLSINPQASLPPVYDVVRVVCEVIIMLIPPAIIPWFTLVHHKKMASSIFYAIIMLGIIDAALFFIFKKLEPIPNIIQIILFVQLGASLSIFFTTLVLRLCGFRMIKATEK